MKSKLLVTAALLAAASLTSPARADNISLNFSGGGVFTSIALTYHPNPNTGPLGSSPNLVDPVGSYVIDSVTGTFSDANIGLSNVAITGLVAISPALPEPDNYLAPNSFSGYPVPNFPPHYRLTYDNLLYPGGSPQSASDYPFHGGYFDIYGLLFTIAGGDVVNLWSAGDFGGGATYGVGVTDGLNSLDYVESGMLVPEPGSFLLFGSGLLGLLAFGRRAASGA